MKPLRKREAVRNNSFSFHRHDNTLCSICSPFLITAQMAHEKKSRGPSELVAVIFEQPW